LIDDILDYTRTSQELGKEALSDLKEVSLTFNVFHQTSQGGCDWANFVCYSRNEEQ